MRWGISFRRPLSVPTLAQPMPWKASLRIVLARHGGTGGSLVQPGWGEEGTNAAWKCRAGLQRYHRNLDRKKKVQECAFNVLLLKRRTLKLNSKRWDGHGKVLCDQLLWGCIITQICKQENIILCVPRTSERLRPGTCSCVLCREDAHDRAEHTGERKTW